jgi:hypothetical protein
MRAPTRTQLKAALLNYANAGFACGDWRNADDVCYNELHRAFLAAEEHLWKLLDQLLAQLA